jgi:RhoGAP domain
VWSTIPKDDWHGVAGQQRGIFGVPLNVSIKYANVAISLTNANGKSFIYGYVPIVVAKCGVFLKEKGSWEHRPSLSFSWTPAKLIPDWTATDVEGIFRLNGSARRIKDLQEIFDSPERYGKGLDWSGYTVHDAANVLVIWTNCLNRSRPWTFTNGSATRCDITNCSDSLFAVSAQRSAKKRKVQARRRKPEPLSNAEILDSFKDA